MSRVADPGSRGANSPGGANIRFCQIFPKTAWNRKNLDPRRGCASLAPPLDPPLVNFLFMNLSHSQVEWIFDSHLPMFPVCHCRCRNPKCRVFLSDWQVKVRPISGGFLPCWSLRVEKDCMLRQSFLSPIWQRVYMCVIGSAVCNTLAGPNYTFSTVDIRKLFTKICYELRRFIARRARPMYFTKSFQKCLDFSPKNPSNLNLDL